MPTVKMPPLSDLKIVPSTWKWREGQRELAERIANSPKKIIIMEVECGGGKSVIPIAAASAKDAQVAILIETIQLQEQYQRDFEGAQLMMGRSHFNCVKNGHTADLAPCTIGAKCELRGVWDRITGDPIGTLPECDYFRAKAQTKKAPISVFNYAYWLGETKSRRSSFGKFSWIVCDEAHALDQILMSAATLAFSHATLARYEITPPPTDDVDVWKRWAVTSRNQLKLRMLQEMNKAGMTGDDDLDGDNLNIPLDLPRATLTAIRQIKELITLTEGVINDVNADDWVYHEKGTWSYWKPIYGKYGFRRILEAAEDKVVLMSAFLAPKMLMATLDLNPDDCEIIEAPPVYDRKKSPIYYCPVDRFNYQTPKQTWHIISRWAERVARRKNSKGLFHVPSTALRNTIVEGAANPGMWYCYDGSDAKDPIYVEKDECIAEFVSAADGPAIMLGQSISTGLDLPYVPKWQIVSKLWFPPMDDPAIQARQKVDPMFQPYYTICQIVQAAGRAKRAPDHDAETYILDASFGWFYSKNKDHFPSWFKNALVYKGWNFNPDLMRDMNTMRSQSGLEAVK